MDNGKHMGGQVLVIAHRGAAGYAPENTMAAFELAIQMRADMLELDIQLSKDGELVVIHDETVSRTTNGSGNVRDLTLAEIRELDAGSWFNDRFSDQHIPILSEVLDLCRGKIGVLIEIKWPQHYPDIEFKLAAELIARNMNSSETDKVIVQSFDSCSIAHIHSIIPHVPVGVLVAEASSLTTDKLLQLSAFSDYINPYLDLVTSEHVDRIHSYGMKIFAWTVRSLHAVEPLMKAGIDGIITDYPDYIAR